jgi:anti-sigma factor RsiW
VGAILVLVAMAALVASFRRDPGLAVRISQEYVAMMAGTLTPAVSGGDAVTIAGQLSRTLAFTPPIQPRVGDFNLVGGRVHQLDGRPVAVWFYRADSAEMALGMAFAGTLTELGPADETRTGAHPPLTIFRKSSQTLVFWQDGELLYVFVATLPGERVIGMARQLATVTAPSQEPRG